jgi:Skp family chaperone for outer membrane proteins
MTRFLLSAVLAATLVCSLHGDDKTVDLPIGLIDVAYIFKHYKPANEKLAALKPALQELEKTVQLRQVEIEQVQRRLAAPKDGDDVAKLRAQFAKLQQDLRVFVETERQKFQKRELDIQAEIYKLVQAEVQRISKERGLKLVLVRPRGNLETDDAGELNRTLNQLVIYEDGLDLTDEVLKALEATAEKTEDNADK